MAYVYELETISRTLTLTANSTDMSQNMKLKKYGMKSTNWHEIARIKMI